MQYKIKCRWGIPDKYILAIYFSRALYILHVILFCFISPTLAESIEADRLKINLKVAEARNNSNKNSNHFIVNIYSTWRDNIACIDTCGVAWLIGRYVDPQAEFHFYEPGTMKMEGIPFCVPQAELQVTARTTAFEAAIQKYGLKDPALDLMARIIRDIDLNKWGEKVTPEAKGIEAVFRGMAIVAKNDDEKMMEQGFMLFDALYADLKARTGS